MLSRLREDVAASPDDALFQTALSIYTGDYTKPHALLTSPDYTYPSYVRGDDHYQLVHWLFAAHLVLKYSGH